MEIGTEIISSIEERDLLSEHFEVLERVKELLLLPGTECMTTAQVADFYEVSIPTIKSLTKDHRTELDSDGLYLASRAEVLKFLKGTLETAQGKTKITSEVDGNEYVFTNRGLLLYTRRAVLRVGMLLRDSEVAKEVRTQLLNIEEKTEQKTKVQNIDEEQQLMLNVGKAFASGDVTEVIKAATEYTAFQNRHIQQLKEDNHLLANGNLKWSERSRLNAAVRKLANTIKIPVYQMWNELYTNLLYKCGISVKQRGEAPYIQWIKEKEWADVIKVFSAMCETYQLSPSEILHQNAK